MLEVRATVRENGAIAQDIFSLTLDCGTPVRVRSGQFAMLGVEGFPLRRPIAICKAQGSLVTVCYRLKGEGTRALARLAEGDRLSALLPLGNGFYLAPQEQRVALVGGGVGIFPLISVIGAYAAQRKLYAYMGFRNASALCMQQEMQACERLVLASDDGSFGVHGTSVQAFFEEYDSVRPDVVLACGPTPMLRALKQGMQGRGVPCYVSLEERMGCGIGACLVCVCERTDGAHARVCKDGPVFEIGDVVL